MDKARQGYNKLHNAMSWLTEKISRDRLDVLVAPHATNQRTLEVGSYGRPRYGRFFSNRIGIDIREGPGVDRVANVYELPFREGEFDVVLCMVILEHLKEPARAIAEMRRVLKQGGRIIVSVPFILPMHDTPGDYWRFTKYGLQYLFADGWNIQELKGETTTQESLAVFLQRLSYQTKARFNGPTKLFLLLMARLLSVMPNMFPHVFGNIQKTIDEPDAFASSFFLVATKS